MPAAACGWPATVWLYPTQIRNGTTSFGQANFDISRDGSRIVIPSAESAAYPLVVVPNWLTEFRQRLGVSKR